jgi:hypothetical protein
VLEPVAPWDLEESLQGWVAVANLHVRPLRSVINKINKIIGIAG